MKALRIVAVVTASLIGVTALAGCSGTGSQSCDRSHPQHLGLVYGSTANSAAPELSADASRLLDDAAASNGSVTIVTPSGTPVVTGPIPLASPANDAAICTADHASAVSVVKAVLQKSVAKSKEVDYLHAIADAARVDTGSTVGVVVVGSGLQTAGILNFTKNDLLYGDPTAIAHQMAVRNELPTALKGLTIYWSGMGDVAAPQEALPESAKKNLQAIWTAVIKNAGGKLDVLAQPLTAAPKLGLPTVTPVSVRPVALTPDWSAPLNLSDAQLHFGGGSDQLVNPDTAKVLLSKVAASIAERRVHVTVTGATSAQGGASQADDIALSKRRAATVIALLERLKVPSGLLTASGVGHKWCGFHPEVASGGRTANEIAAQNRRVVLTAEGVSLCG